MKSLFKAPPLAILSAALLFQVPAVAQGGANLNARNVESQLFDVRRATAHFNDVFAAMAADYHPFADTSGIYCIANPPHGAMGIHYVNGNLFSLPLDPTTPHALVYEPTADGKVRLAGVEYIVFQEPWDQANKQRPKLFGQHFHHVPAGNRYGIPAFYALHVWLWDANPNGIFADWNPWVRCP